MTKLASVYSRSTGLRLDRPNVKEAFYPHPFERYVTIQTGSGQPAKNYPLFADVVRLLKPILDANRITILHLGGKDDPALAGVHDLRGKTGFLQANYLIGRTLLHVGNDSWLAHCAGWHFKPLVVLFGSTSPQNHSPYWLDVAKTILIESHRYGGRPTFAQESPSTISLIPPEQVANAILRLLGIGDQFAHQSRFFGALYQHLTFDLIPNSVPAPGFNPQVPMTVRMDYLHNETILAQVLQSGRKVNVITAKPIDPNLLAAFRASILSYNHEVTAAEPLTLTYVDTIRTLLPRHTFFTRETDTKVVADLRLHYFDHVNVEQVALTSREDYLAAACLYLNRPDTPETRLDLTRELSHTRFRSSKVVLSDGKAFISRAHMAAGISTDSLQSNEGAVIDTVDFFRDLNHMTLFHVPPV